MPESTMPIIDWNIKYMLGIKEIDQHHRHLVDLLNTAYDDFKNGASVGQSVISELADYVSYHFSCEERWMMETQYPNFAAHKEEHDSFAERVFEFRRKYIDSD